MKEQREREREREKERGNSESYFNCPIVDPVIPSSNSHLSSVIPVMRATDLIGEGGFFHSLHISLSLSLSLCPFTFSLFFFSSYSVIFPLLLSQAKVNQVLTFSLLLLIDRWIIFLSMCPFFSFLVSFLRQNSIQCYVLSDGRITRQKCLSWCMRKGRGRDEPKLKCNSHPKS